MVEMINDILNNTIKSEGDYKELSEYLYITFMTSHDKEYNQLIDEIQLLILRKVNRFVTFSECENLYKKIKVNLDAYAK